MHSKRGSLSPVTRKPSNHFTRNVGEGSLESGVTISSGTPRSPRTQVYHLCQAGLRGSKSQIQTCSEVSRQHSVRHTRPCCAKSSFQSVDLQIQLGSVNPVAQPISSIATTTTFPWRLSEDKLSVEVTRQRRYGPSRLCVNDDDGRISRAHHSLSTSIETSYVDATDVEFCCVSDSASRV